MKIFGIILLSVFSIQLGFAQQQNSAAKSKSISPSAANLDSAEEAIKNGNAKTLSLYFSESVEISFDGKKQNYSRTQAEFVMKDFFSKNPSIPNSFEKFHTGNSSKNLGYSILKYSSQTGSYQVFLKIKQHQGRYLIDALNLTQE
jgi:Domain of unknown function (DUF4783)